MKTKLHHLPMRHYLSSIAIIAICCLLSYPSIANKHDKESTKQILETVRKSTDKISFEQNAGQFADEVLFGFRTSFGSMGIYRNKLRIAAIQKKKGNFKGNQLIDITFPGSNHEWTITPGTRSATKGSYNNDAGNSIQPDIYNELTLQNVYPGIDLRLYSGKNGVLEFDWLVSKASDYAKINMHFDGQDAIHIKKSGDIVLDLRYQDIHIVIPETYQIVDGKKRLFETTMKKSSDRKTLAYAIAGDLNPEASLVIDPIMQWSTYFDNGEALFDEYAYSIAIGVNDEVYVGGMTNRTISQAYMSDVPAGFSATYSTVSALIYRLNPNGTAITAWTMTGAGTSNRPATMELFPDGRVLVGYSNGLIQIYSSDLSTRIFSAEPVAVNAINTVRIINNDVFYTSGVTAALPAALVSGAPDDVFAGTTEGFIMRFSDAITGVPVSQWATYVGGSGTEYFTSIALTPDKTKMAFSTQTGGGTGFPALVNEVDASVAGTELVVGVIPQQATVPSAFEVLSFLGGSDDEGDLTTTMVGLTVTCASALVACDSNYFYIAGNTQSADFPGVSGGVQPTHAGNMDQVISRIALGGQSTGFVSTYMGGAGEDLIGGLLIEPRSQTVLLFGTTTSTNYPVQNTSPASDFYQTTFGGSIDATYTNFSKDLSSRSFSTYIGGPEKDYMGNTGVLTGSGHLTYNPNSGSAYIATTIHSVEGTMPAQWMSGLPGFDKVTNAQTAGADQHFIFGFNPSTFDYGDAPVGYEGGNPARSVVTYKLVIGNDVDAEPQSNSTANAMGDDELNSGVADDEDGVTSAPHINVASTTYSVPVSVYNNSGATVLLHGWVDANINGSFEATEYASVNVPSDSTQQTVTLSFTNLPVVPDNINSTFLRLRISSVSLSAADATGAFGSGEVEDHEVRVAVRVAGTIFNDPNGLANGLVDGTPIGVVDSLPMYVYLVNSNGAIVDIATVSASGTYAFESTPINQSYTLVLSTLPGTLGSTTASPELTGTWVNTGESCCSQTGNDGNPNGILPLNVGNTDLTNANFGIFDPNATGTLPLVLESFDAFEHNCSTLLSWTTSSEENTSHTEIWRKETKAATFKKMGSVANVGFSKKKVTYSYSDKEVNPNTSYDYQLRFVDIDSRFTNSVVRNVSLTCTGDKASIKVFPNPANQELNILYLTEQSNVELNIDLVDLSGRKLLSKSQLLTSGANVISLNINTLASGTYMLYYQDTEGIQRGTIKFSKQ